MVEYIDIAGEGRFRLERSRRRLLMTSSRSEQPAFPLTSIDISFGVTSSPAIVIPEDPTAEAERLRDEALAMPPTRLAIVLDIDETCVRSHEDSALMHKHRLLTAPEHIDVRQRLYRISLDNVNMPRGSGHHHQIWGVTRPQLEIFLQFCFAYFKSVNVWSAGQYQYVHKMVEILFTERQPDRVLTYDDCKSFGNGYTKPLALMYEGHPKGIDSKTTLLLDDRWSVFRYDNPDNGVQVPPFAPKSLEEFKRDETSLLEFMRWLMRSEVRSCPDVRLIPKGGIFSGDVREE